jgi:hypothetical protein
MQKLNLEFSAGQVMKALWLNLISQKTDEIVDEVNTLPAMRAATEEVALRVDAVEAEGVDISQADFDALQESGNLDPTKTYYIYE